MGSEGPRTWGVHNADFWDGKVLFYYDYFPDENTSGTTGFTEKDSFEGVRRAESIQSRIRERGNRLRSIPPYRLSAD